MIPADRFLEGLFMPHGGINFQPSRHPSTSNQLARVIEQIVMTFTSPIRWIVELLGRMPTKKDFVLCH